MDRFSRVLRRAESGLRLPEAHRTRILAEVGQDLEDAYRAYRAAGLGEEEAARRAERLVGLSEPAVSELGRLHATGYARLLDRFSTRGAHRVERGLLAGLTGLAVVLGVAGIAASGGPAGGSSPVVWVLVMLLAGVLALALADRLADLRGAAHPVESPFGVLATLAAIAVGVGLLGALLELWRLGGGETDGRTVVAIAAAIGGAAERLASGLIVALVALLTGFHLRSRRRAAARRRARIPGLGTSLKQEVDA